MWIFNNLFYKLVAGLIALVLWAAAQGFQSVEQGIDLPIVLADLPDDLVVVDQSAREVNIRIKGSRAALRRAERSLERYTLSLEGVHPGESHFEIHRHRLSDSLPRGAEITARSPSALVIRTEPRATRLLPVRVETTGSPPPGLRLSLEADPPEVLVEGARSAVNQLDFVPTERVDLREMQQTRTVEVPYVLDAANAWVRSDPQTVRVRVIVEPEAAPPTARGGR